jgi:hypothetical protein
MRQRVLPIVVKTRFHRYWLFFCKNLVLRDEHSISPESLCPFASLGWLTTTNLNKEPN